MLFGPTTSVCLSLVLPGERSDEVVAFETAVVGFFVDAADLLGVPKSVAAIYGICFASPAPLTFVDIERRLDLSKGSISQGLRFLRGIGALKQVSTLADRSGRFEPDIELRKLISLYVEQRLGKHLDAGKKRILGITASIPRHEPVAARKLAGRVEVLNSWHSKSLALLPLVKGALVQS